MRKIFIVIAILLPWGITNAQTYNNVVSVEINAYRPSDQIVKQQIEYIDPGMEGVGLTWNFSKKACNGFPFLEEYCRQVLNNNTSRCREHPRAATSCMRKLMILFTE